MRAILVIGWKSPTSGPEGLYCGLDGAKAMEIAGKAKKTGKYHAMRYISNVETVGRPLPVKPDPEPEAAPATPPADPKAGGEEPSK